MNGDQGPSRGSSQIRKHAQRRDALRAPVRILTIGPIRLMLLAASVLTLNAACGGEPKITAEEAARQLRQQMPTVRDLRCNETGGSWDYACSYTPPDGSPRETIEVRVNDQRITARSAP